MHRNLLSLLLPVLVFAGFSATGCALSSRAVVADLNSNPPQKVLARVLKNQMKISTLYGKGHLTVETPEQNFKGQVEIRVRKPDSVLIVAQVALGMDVGFFFADGSRFAHYSPFENVFYTGPSDKLNRLMLFRMQVTHRELIDAVTGTYRFDWTPDTEADIRDGDYVLRKKSGNDMLEVMIDPAKFVVKKVVLLDSSGKEIAVQKFRTFRKINGAWLPKYIQIFRKETHERLTVFYEKLTVNKKLPANEFTFKVPENAEKYRLK